MKKRWIAFWIAVFLCEGVALAAVVTDDGPDPDDPHRSNRGLFSSMFDNY